MTTEQKIREAFKKYKESTIYSCTYEDFESVYLALLNSLEHGGVSRYMPTYRLPEGVENEPDPYR